MTYTSSIRAEQPVPRTLGSAQSAPQNRRKFGTLGTTQGFLEVQIPLSPPTSPYPHAESFWRRNRRGAALFRATEHQHRGSRQSMVSVSELLPGASGHRDQFESTISGQRRRGP